MIKINSFFFFLILFLFSCSVPYSDKKLEKKLSSHEYSRKAWPHWSDFNKNCLNTRAEILKARSLSRVQLNKKGCNVTSGEWPDYYYPEKIYKSKDVDIDHLVPLKHAHDHGGDLWSREKKELFANDPENLVITNKTYNRAKGPKGIDEWLPAKIDYACKYVKDWIKIKSKYALFMGPSEKKTIQDLKERCPGL